MALLITLYCIKLALKFINLLKFYSNQIEYRLNLILLLYFYILFSQILRTRSETRQNRQTSRNKLRERPLREREDKVRR